MPTITVYLSVNQHRQVNRYKDFINISQVAREALMREIARVREDQVKAPECPNCGELLNQVYRYTRDKDRYGLAWEKEGGVIAVFERNVNTEPSDGKWYCYHCDFDATEIVGRVEFN